MQYSDRLRINLIINKMKAKLKILNKLIFIFLLMFNNSDTCITIISMIIIIINLCQTQCHWDCHTDTDAHWDCHTDTDAHCDCHRHCDSDCHSIQ